MHAMHEQMKAERTRRAVVTEAEGSREAAITRAEGEKKSAILTAEGQRQKDILDAEGEAAGVRTRAEAEQYRQEVVAEGEADAIRIVYQAITESGTDDRVIAIKYLEASQEHRRTARQRRSSFRPRWAPRSARSAGSPRCSAGGFRRADTRRPRSDARPTVTLVPRPAPSTCPARRGIRAKHRLPARLHLVRSLHLVNLAAPPGQPRTSPTSWS